MKQDLTSTNVTLIFTRHKEEGNCSSQNLLRIIEHVQPDVIFEELSAQLYQMAHELKTLATLEALAIEQYIAKHPCPIIPVDTFERPENYDRNQDILMRSLTKEAGQQSAQLRGFLDSLVAAMHQYGFLILNDVVNEKNMDILEELKLATLQKLNDPKLDAMYLLDQEVIQKREDVILDNVYRYVRNNKFNRGLMFIGSGHMKSIKQKIEEKQRSENNPVNWLFYSDLGTKET